MKKVKKIIAATAAAFAVIAAIGATTAFANSDAVPPVDEVNNQVPGTYMYFEWGGGYAKTINATSNYRRCLAEVSAFSNLTGEQVAHDAEPKDCYHNEYAYAKVSSEFIGPTYNYKCYGSIRGNTSPSSPVMEFENRVYPLPET